MILSLFIALITDTYETIKVGSSVAISGSIFLELVETIKYSIYGGGELMEC